jgi:hypothetical protein
MFVNVDNMFPDRNTKDNSATIKRVRVSEQAPYNINAGRTLYQDYDEMDKFINENRQTYDKSSRCEYDMVGISGFSGFSDVQTVLKAGSPVTFTYAMNKTIDLSWPSTTAAKITADLAPYGQVTNADRGLFSGRYTITITPSYDMAPDVWQNLVLQSMINAGYPDATFVAMEGGTLSTQAGGSQQVITETAHKVATGLIKPVVQGAVDMGTAVVSPLVKPLIIIGIVAALGFGAYIYTTNKVRSLLY